MSERALNLYGIRYVPKIAPERSERQFFHTDLVLLAGIQMPIIMQAMAGMEKFSAVGSWNTTTPLKKESRMLTLMDRSPVPARSCSACTAQKQSAPPITQRSPQSTPTGARLNWPVTPAIMAEQKSAPTAMTARNDHEE